MRYEDEVAYLSYVGTMEDIERELAGEAQPVEPIELNPKALREIAALTASLGPVPDGLSEGSCVGHEDPDLWFREDEKSQAQAKAICLECPAREACSTSTDVHGIWGGEDRDAKACKRGHVGRWYRKPDGHLRCQACHNEDLRASRAKRKEAAHGHANDLVHQ